MGQNFSGLSLSFFFRAVTTKVFFQQVVVDIALNVGVEAANDVVAVVEILTVYAVLIIVLSTIVPEGAENCAMYVAKLQSRYTYTMSK
jgi:hypothetical protein